MRSQAEDLHLVRPSAVEGANQRTVDKYKRVRAAGRVPKNFRGGPGLTCSVIRSHYSSSHATEWAFGSR
jgi:hypothetical protein